MYDTIVLPVDGSGEAPDAVEHAATLGEREGATVHVLSVVERSRVRGSADDSTGRKRREVVQSVTERVDEVGAETVIAVERGSPGETIIEYAESVDADLVVMGTHARSGVNRSIRGSVTETVLRKGGVPVLAVQR